MTTTAAENPVPGCIENGCRGVGVWIVTLIGGGGFIWCDEHKPQAKAYAIRSERKVTRLKP